MTIWPPVGEPPVNDLAEPRPAPRPSLPPYPRVAFQSCVEGRALLVVEIRSPGDETFDKLPFYERMGVAEMLVIDRDSKALRRWVRTDDGLDEVGPDSAGSHQLTALPVTLHTIDGRLVVRGHGHESLI